MATPRNPSRKALTRRNLRAAVLIHEQIVGEGCLSPLPPIYDHDWHELNKSMRRYEVARAKGWLTAAESLISGMQVSAAGLGRQLDRFRYGLPSPFAASMVQSPREILADITALAQEFEQVELNLKEKQLAVVTLPIELQDVYLGPFRIRLDWDEIGNSQCYRVLAEDPHPADANEETTHPHVNGEDLCEGEGSTAIHKALVQGRLLDFFILVRQVLQTYNPGSAYVSLSRWNGGSDCSDCGYSMDEDESYGCSRCGNSVCGECRTTCEACDEWVCGGCSFPCHECEEAFCRNCLKPHPQTQALTCPSCLEKGDNLDDDETPASPEAEQSHEGCPCGPASPPDPIRLEEALVPA
jgi:hypothetical protein